MKDENSIPADLRDHPTRYGRLSPHSRGVLVGIGGCLVAFVIVLILDFFGVVSLPEQNRPQSSTNSSPIRPPAKAPGVVQGENAEERTRRLNGTYFYDPETPVSKLARTYTDALSEAVVNKNPKNCQSGLKNFREELLRAPMAVRMRLAEQNTARDWQIPVYVTFLDAAHFTYACQQATRLDHMSDLAPDSRARNAQHIMRSDEVNFLTHGPKACFDLLSKDYKYYVQNTSVAGRVMLSLITPMLPQELTDKKLATFCHYTPTK